MSVILRFLRWCGLPVGWILFSLTRRSKSRFVRIAGAVNGFLLGGLGGLVDYWSLRPNRAWLNLAVPIESWDVVNDGLHNSNTDMIYWQGAFYLVHAASPYHLRSAKCRLVVLRSEDARRWQPIARLDTAPVDIRDPKFASIGGKLFLYALKNVALNPEPYVTVVSSSLDGTHWQPFEEVEPQGWLFWRPKSQDDVTWYVPAYWWEHGRSALFRSTDGVHWELVSPIYAGGRNDETDFVFLPDGRLLATARLEYSESVFGHPQGSTLIAACNPPYTSWHPQLESWLTRLDGPNLFTWNGRVYAVGRYQPEIWGPIAWQGSAFARKRTTLFSVSERGLKRLTDLPSSGDTSYSGVVVRDGSAYICYYTSAIERDPTWIVGMLDPSSIRMARIPLAALEAAANEP